MVLLDAEYAAAQALAAGAVPGSTGVAVPLEGMGYGDVAKLDVTTFLEGWSPEKARRLGASGAKLLLPYRVDVADQAERQERGRRRGGRAAAGRPAWRLILEPIVYQREGEERAGGDRFAELVVEGARRLATLEPDVLKLQYPGSAEACAELDGACGSLIPWVLLGGGADPAVLEGQIEDACRAGASGFIVGRTLFDAALVEDEAESDRALARAVPAAAGAAGRRSPSGWRTPWRERVGALPAPAARLVPVSSAGPVRGHQHLHRGAGLGQRQRVLDLLQADLVRDRARERQPLAGGARAWPGWGRTASSVSPPMPEHRSRPSCRCGGWG